MDSDQIQKAIAAHGMWKRRLIDAIDAGSSDVSVAQTEPDNVCPFGKWLYALPASERNSEYFKKVQPLHAAFHKEAAKVLSLALSGKKAEAQKCMASSGQYLAVSAKLTSAMMDWQKALVSKTR